MTAPDTVYQLVEKFERDKSRFLQLDYNEAQLREQFVNPFFRAMGWDLGEEVLHEAGLRSGGSVKHPDYTFLAGNRRAFYVETKKPAIDIGASVEPAEQLRSYGWSGDTALGILTNFAEFAVYDCRIEPKQGDSPAEARVRILTCQQYLEEWDWLCAALSPDAVRQGKHRDLLETTAKGMLRVDEAFLRDMESWRADLAPDIYKQARFIERKLSQREINHLVQRTIDRIVFLRIAEDRNLESYGRLERAAAVRRNSYSEIKRLYLAADRRYNSGLFHFNPNDRSRPDADTLSLDIRIGDGILRRIIGDLYPPRSRYQFSVISADILGQVYERFLGKVIEVRSDGESTTVTVDEKPEVRKAGGVYYTPAYIVDYIVENTVGALLKGKTPEEAMRLRVLDPACGSGSFLTGAYDFLLDWHLAQYQRQPERYRNRLRRVLGGTVLDIREKRRILLDNIYGVDLDQNAVEVSKLALLLKMLENEGDAADLEEPLLPDLSGNIKWGNSLIGSDFFSGRDLAAQDDEALLRVKPFDWASGSGFGEIMAAGGFDAVIGNPPYGATLDDTQQDYLRTLYSVAEYQLDTYPLFIEKAHRLAKLHSFCGFIVPSAWIASKYDKELRSFLVKNVSIHNMVIAPKNAFKDATVETVIFVFGKTSTNQKSFEVERWDIEPTEKYHVSLDHIKLDKDHIFRVYSRPKVTNLIHKLNSTSVPISRHGQAVWGVKVYQRGKGKPPQIGEESIGKIFHSSEKVKDTHLPLLGGREIVRYSLNWRGGYVDYGEWLAEPRTPNWFEGERILIREVTSKGQIHATIVEDKFVFSNSVDGLKITSDAYNIKFVLGILNSKLITFYHFNSSPNAFKGTFPKVLVKDILSFPLPQIPESTMHDKMAELVDIMLDLHRQLPRLTAVQRGVVEQRIEAVDREIDALVYALYGLSEDEVAVVEGG